MENLRVNHVDVPYVPHKTETADELYDLVIRRMRARASSGCRSLNFHWDYVFSDSEEEYREHRAIVLEVVQRLRAEGLAVSAPGFKDGDKWPQAIQVPYIGGPETVEPREIHHNIYVDWGPGESLTQWKQDHDREREWP